MSVDRDDPFGDGNTWADVQSHIGRVLRGKFGSFYREPEVFEDVLGEVVIDLLGYWSSLPSAQNDEDTLSFTRAVNRGVKHGTRLMWDEIHRRQQSMNVYLHEDFDEEVADGQTYDDEFDRLQGKYTSTPSVTTEDVVLDKLEADGARQFLSSLSHSDLREYFDGPLSGKSYKALSRESGVSDMTVAKHQRKSLQRLRKQAADFGLCDRGTQ